MHLLISFNTSLLGNFIDSFSLYELHRREIQKIIALNISESIYQNICSGRTFNIKYTLDVELNPAPERPMYDQLMDIQR